MSEPVSQFTVSANLTCNDDIHTNEASEINTVEADILSYSLIDGLLTSDGEGSLHSALLQPAQSSIMRTLMTRVDEQLVDQTSLRSDADKSMSMNQSVSETSPTSCKNVDTVYRGQHCCPFITCDKRFISQNSLKTHLRIHTGERPFVCGYVSNGLECNKTFSTAYSLKTHMRTHTDQRPYVCTYIQQTDSSSSRLLNNEVQMLPGTGGGSVCGKGFKTSGDLRKHIRTHTGVRPFRCDYADCDMSFTTSNILKVHQRTHNGERPYHCTTPGCTKSFASSTNYKNHLRIHSGDKPYICSVEGCGKGFTEYSSLYKHLVVHRRDKPYPCTLCGKMYRQTSTLAMHRRMVHNVADSNNSNRHTLADGNGANTSSSADNSLGSSSILGCMSNINNIGSVAIVSTADSINDSVACSMQQHQWSKIEWRGQELVQQESSVETSQPIIGLIVTTTDGLSELASADGHQFVIQLADCPGLIYDDVDNQLVIDTDIFQQQQ